MKQDFEKFKRWLADNYPEGLDDLNPPATDNEVETLKNGLGFEIPEDLILLLKIHNGQKGDAGGLFDEQEFLSSYRILDEWKVWSDLLDGGEFEGYSSEPESGIKNSWWNKKWIPITYNGAGDHYCLDVDPSESGTEGQVMTMWHDSADRELLSESLNSWFGSYVLQILSGDYVYSDEYESIVSKDDV